LEKTLGILYVLGWRKVHTAGLYHRESLIKIHTKGKIHKFFRGNLLIGDEEISLSIGNVL
jgi:hypothetical protein